MSQIFFCFKSSKKFEALPIPPNFIVYGGHGGQGVRVIDLRELIMRKKGLQRLPGTLDFELHLSNAQTQERYAGETQIVPINSSIIVRRLPVAPSAGLTDEDGKPASGDVAGRSTAKSASNFAALHNSSASGATSDTPLAMSLATSVTRTTLNAASASEEDRLSAVIASAAVSTSSSFSSSRHGDPSDAALPPPNYICHRCQRGGHYIKNCPTNDDPGFEANRLKRPTGIPKAFLKQVAPTTGQTITGAMQLPGGHVAVAMPNSDDFMRKKNEQQLQQRRGPVAVPPQLQCPICSQLLRDAVSIPCCNSVFCDACIRAWLLDEATAGRCPRCSTVNSTFADRLMPHREARASVIGFIAATGGAVQMSSSAAAAASSSASASAVSSSSSSSASAVSSSSSSSSSSSRRERSRSPASRRERERERSPPSYRSGSSSSSSGYGGSGRR